MNRRSKTRLCASMLALATASCLHAESGPSPTPEKEVNDTVVSEATRSIIETFGDLSRTATKLSETALKLLEAQEEIDRRREGGGEIKNQTTTRTRRTTGKRNGSGAATQREESEATSRPTGNGVYLGEEPEYDYTGIETEEQTGGPGVFISETPEETDTLSGTLESIWDLQPEEGKGGHYIWVPDGEQLHVTTGGGSQPDLNEKTYWRGDSIPMAIPTKRLGRYDRKLYNWLIYPKGKWHISLSANYGELSSEDSELLSLMKDIDLGGKIYSIKPSVSYFIGHNMCAGVRLAFTKGELAIDNFSVDIDEDMNFNLHDIKYSSDSYAAAIFLQQYFGLSRRGRFAVFNELEVAFGSGNKHFIRPFDGEMKDTRTKTNSFNINYSPGVSIMMMKNAAFNLSFGIFGFHLQDEKQWENGEESGKRLTSGINFRFNIFNINFGVSIII